jgi:hypothetical protein
VLEEGCSWVLEEARSCGLDQIEEAFRPKPAQAKQQWVALRLAARAFDITADSSMFLFLVTLSAASIASLLHQTASDSSSDSFRRSSIDPHRPHRPDETGGKVRASW